MPKEKESQLGSDPAREPFITIDDLVLKAEELASGLRTLSEYKHPLVIRRGRKTRQVHDLEHFEPVDESGLINYQISW